MSKAEAKKAISFVCLPFLLIISCSEPSHKKDDNPSGDFDVQKTETSMNEFKGLIDQLWKEGYAKKDTVLVSKLYHPKFNLIDDEGSVFTKEEELAYVGEYGDQYENFSYTVDDILFFENSTGIVYTNCKFLGTDASGQVFSTEYLQSLIFLKDNQEWKIIYSQVSGVKETTIASVPQE